MKSFYQDESTTLYCGDCAAIMPQLPAESVDLTITSPPYDRLRTYGGCDWNFGIFCDIAKNLYRMTRIGGVVVWVVGDATINGSETGTSFRQALFFKEIGFNLHDTMIYEKKNPIPQNHNRYEQSFEYMFVFSKGTPKTFSPLTAPTINGGKVINWGDRRFLDANQCRRNRSTDELICKNTKNRNNIFTYSIGGGKTGHPAVFPLQLATDHVLSWSKPDDVIFDPFAGSGTVGIAAMNEGRQSLMIELEDKYCEIIARRCKDNREKIEKSNNCIQGLLF